MRAIVLIGCLALGCSGEADTVPRVRVASGGAAGAAATADGGAGAAGESADAAPDAVEAATPRLFDSCETDADCEGLDLGVVELNIQCRGARCTYACDNGRASMDCDTVRGWECSSETYLDHVTALNVSRCQPHGCGTSSDCGDAALECVEHYCR